MDSFEPVHIRVYNLNHTIPWSGNGQDERTNLTVGWLGPLTLIEANANRPGKRQYSRSRKGINSIHSYQP